MIKKFEQYNESLRDNMKGISIEEYINTFHSKIDDPDDYIDAVNVDIKHLFELIKTTNDINNDGDFVKFLKEKNYLNDEEIIQSSIYEIENIIKDEGLYGAKHMLRHLLNLIKK